MDLEQRVGSFHRAGIGLVTTVICLALLSLLVFILLNINGRFSLEIIAFCAITALIAIWFAKLSYQLIFRSTKEDTNLLSPISILCIFSIAGLGAIAGIIYRFSSGSLKEGFISILILVLLFPLGNYCWRLAKKNGRNSNGT